jgi:cytochrome c-type biogenesis protein CcmH/NrfG
VETTEQQSKRWKASHGYGLAIICFLIGTVGGFLLRTPTDLSARPEPAQLNSGVAEVTSITPEQVKHMADKKADPLFEKLKANPNDAEVLAEIGRTYLLAHEFETAIGYYERSVKIKPDPRVLTTLGGAYHYMHADDKAMESWNRALQIDPTCADALFNVGMVKWQSQGDVNGAIAAWEQLLKTNPDHPQRTQVEQLIARAKQHRNMSPKT